MTIEILSNGAVYDPSGLIPYVEKDEAIIRALTKGMLDFSHPDCYAGSGAVASGTTFASLTSDAGVATAGTALGTVANGMLPMGSATSAHIALPDTFKLPNTTKKFLAIVWAKLPASGWPGTGATSNSLLAHASNTTTLGQWGIHIRHVLATGIPDALLFQSPKSGSTSIGVALSGVDTLAVCDGNLHQIACVWDGSTPGTLTRAVYVDKVSKTVSTPSEAWDNTFPTPTAVARLGACPAFQSKAPTAGITLGRPSLWNLTDSSKSVAEIIAADWDAAQGYLS